VCTVGVHCIQHVLMCTQVIVFLVCSSWLACNVMYACSCVYWCIRTMHVQVLCSSVCVDRVLHVVHNVLCFFQFYV